MMNTKYVLALTSRVDCVGEHKHSFAIIRDKDVVKAIKRQFRKTRIPVAIWQCRNCEKVIQSS